MKFPKITDINLIGGLVFAWGVGAPLLVVSSLAINGGSGLCKEFIDSAKGQEVIENLVENHKADPENYPTSHKEVHDYTHADGRRTGCSITVARAYEHLDLPIK